jgi:hypothetical protein
MKPERKQISAALIEHLEREELHSGQAAAFLNLNPCYISMAKSEKSWGAMSNTAWARLEEWFNTRENIKDFVIPEGEEIFRKLERDPQTRITEPDVPKAKKEKFSNNDEAFALLQKGAKALLEKDTDEHSPANLIPEIPVAKKEKNGKSVKLVINQAEIEALRKDVDTQNKIIAGFIERFDGIEVKLHSIEEKYSNMLGFLREHEIRLDQLQKQPEKNKKKPSKGIVIFQRNYFKS